MSLLGIFDSGLGGLSIARYCRILLPTTDILYCGDTAHLPYGNKSSASIYKCARQIVQLLVERGARAIAIACSTVCATALAELNAEFGHRALLIEILQPSVCAALEQSPRGRVAVLATQATVASTAYTRAFQQRSKEICVIEIPCPLLATHIEENLADLTATATLLGDYLKPLRHSAVDALLLGCTHYSLVKPHICELLGEDIVVDPAKACALAIARAISLKGPSGPKTDRGKWEWIFTDSPELWIERANGQIGQKVIKY